MSSTTFHGACRLLGALCCIACFPPATAGDAIPVEPKRTIYAGATLVDGTGAPARRDVAIVVRGERIEAVVPAAELSADAGAEMIDMRGRHVVPGLVNAHVHLATPPEPRRAAAMLRRSLYGGVTAVRSMADDTRAVADLARAARVGELAAPDIVFPALFAGPDFFHDPRVVAAARGETAGTVPWLRAVTADTDLREAVTLARGAGATAIKVYAGLDAVTVGAIAREAHQQGLKVWAHAAVFPASPLEVAGAGVDTMSHVCMIAYQGQAMPPAYHDRAPVDEARFVQGIPEAVREVYARMKDRGVILDATNYVYETIERMRAEMPEGQGPPTYCSARLAERLTAEAHRMGVEIAIGTDAFAPVDQPYPAVQREMEIFVTRAGMQPLEAIRSATLIGARALGREADMGSIEAGKLANLVFVASDPVADIGALRDVVLVVKRGTPFRRSDYVPITAAEAGEAPADEAGTDEAH
ncbi:MAG TPA: amidohydrolase family protein [Pseudomonadota bacterium]|nr:amidohydrolase family protein [Pseudomonadota bacterium]HQY35045.1 amidohydrolase family protein [Pseudomonadota bacterium]HRA36866.1 amidohydrolase family protein [Pseudomonadota bacterium]